MADTTDIEREAAQWFDAHWDPTRPLGEWWRDLADSGFAFPQWPEGFGGRGLSGREAKAVLRARRASGAYGELLRDGESSAGKTLLRIGGILESRGRPDAAAQHYRLVAAAFAAEPLGADALWRLACVCRDRLDLPAEALDHFRRYQDLYPPAFRVPTTAGDRIRKLER